MGYQEMKEMPQMLKPILLLLTLLQIIFMASPGLRGWSWFIVLTSVLEFILAVGVFAAVFFDLQFVKSGQWEMIELAYSGVFCVASALCTIYYFCNIFYSFNFFFLLATITSVLIVLAYGLQTLVAWTARSGVPAASASNNQATATAPQPSAFPAGINPA